MSFTGYLLPFDQRSYWATIVGVNINGTGPLLGPFLSDFLRGGPEFTATTLSRFYAIHMLLVPGAIIAMIGAHLYLVAKLGTTAPPWLRAQAASRELVEEAAVNQREKEEYLREYSVLKAEGKPFFPYAVAKDSLMGVRRRRRDHHAVDRARRRARPEGERGDDHLHAAARVVLLLPLRAAARDQAAELRRPGDDRRADDRR